VEPDVWSTGEHAEHEEGSADPLWRSHSLVRLGPWGKTRRYPQALAEQETPGEAVMQLGLLAHGSTTAEASTGSKSPWH
jgi:hypothetical protein